MQETSCPKCQGPMVQGYIPDFTQGARLVSTWREGNPRKSFWFGTKISPTGGVPIGAFRCSGCGYLELYANEQFAAQ
jgi:hypothetical protein